MRQKPHPVSLRGPKGRGNLIRHVLDFFADFILERRARSDDASMILLNIL